LTPLVVAEALGRAGTVVCEPVVRVSLEVPTRSVGVVLPALARLGASVETPLPHDELSTIEALMPVTAADELQRQLAGLTGGEGVVEATFAGYRKV
jgi:ribosomal protection tetracycline resistance protein